MAARYGLIPSELSLGASQGVRRNAADNAFEAVTLTVGGLAGNQSANIVFAGPSSGGAAVPAFRALVLADVASSVLGTGTANSTTFLRGDRTWQTVSASPAGSNTQLQYNNGGSFGASSNLTFDDSINKVTVRGGTSTSSATSLYLDKKDGFNPNEENRLDFGQSTNIYGRIANYYDGGTGIGLKFYTATTGGGLNSTPSLTLKGDGSVEFSLTNGQTISKLSDRVLTLQNKTGSGTASRTSLFLDHDCGFSSGDENRLDFGQGANIYGRIANRYNGTGLEMRFHTWNGGLNSTPALSLLHDNKVEINGSLTLSAQNIITDTTTGMKIGTSTSQKLGFFNATPVTQRANIVALTDSTGGSSGASIDDVGGSFDQGTLNDNFASIVTRINAIEQVFQDLGLTA